jgi:hypothetical protein
MKVFIVCFAFLFGLVSTVCFAAETDERNPYLYERFTLHGGIHYYSASGEFSSDKDGRDTYYVDLDDLGLDEDETTPYFHARLRLINRLSLHMGYFGYHEEGNARNEFTFEFGDLLVPVNARTDSEIDLDVFYANLAYSIYSSPNTEVGAGLGVHGADFSLEITAKFDQVDPPIPLGEETEDFLAPLPNLYFFASHALRENILLHLTGGWMSLSYDDYEGDMFFVRALADYRITKHFGIGGGYSYFDVDVEHDKGRKVENYDVDFKGPVAYLVFGF